MLLTVSLPYLTSCDKYIDDVKLLWTAQNDNCDQNLLWMQMWSAYAYDELYRIDASHSQVVSFRAMPNPSLILRHLVTLPLTETLFLPRVDWLVDLIWFDLIWFDLIWFGLSWFDLIWSFYSDFVVIGVISCNMVSYHMMPCDIMYCSIVYILVI